MDIAQMDDPPAGEIYLVGQLLVFLLVDLLQLVHVLHELGLHVIHFGF